jgi:hypothetical protein
LAAGEAGGGHIQCFHRPAFREFRHRRRDCPQADLLEVLPDVFMPVASIGHLIALKALAGRHQDLTDLGYLISAASDADLDEARASAAMIEERGFNRGQRLSEDPMAIIGQARK